MPDSNHKLVRPVDGRDVPAAGTWMIDPTHTSAEFVARHLMVAKVRGKFNDISGTIVVGDNPADTQVEVTISAASVSTGTPDRDGHLVSADFFDVENYPSIVFKSTGVMVGEGSAGTMAGELTVRGNTKPVELDFEFHGVIDDPWGNSKAAFSASTEVDREEWGLTWNAPLEAGGVLVGKKVKLELEIQAAFAA